ncbi:unnamed protein product [Clonostachys chloroleuca]|uniref:Uncharacterized protein n=1 Tax=Clonostachys chloroleuca TaxID=1926264 RepID=A0AA35QC19_9HYPO|nr:unnamed protein product [Clonostachys chloroleuca]
MPNDPIVVTTEHGASDKAPEAEVVTDNVASPTAEAPATAPEATPEATPEAAPEVPATAAVDAKVKELEEALEEERAYRGQAEADLEKKNNESADLRKRWREAAGELDRYLRQNQGYNQLTDQELIQKVSQLRFEIRNFTIQYFEDQIKDVSINGELLEYLNKYLNLPDGIYETYLKTPEIRSAALRAFFWGFLKSEVFWQYRWAPAKASDCVFYMSDFIKKSLGIEANSKDAPDANRKFHMWRANTSSLLLEATNQNPKEAASSVQKVCADHAKEMVKFVSPLSSSKLEAIEKQLVRLINQSLEIDKEISKQVAFITWKFIDKDSSLVFDPETMELEPGKRKADEKSAIELVLAPGLVKSGKSSGDDFDVELRLLKPEVACAAT